MDIMPDCCASDLGSISGQVCPFFENCILLNSPNQMRNMEKNLKRFYAVGHMFHGGREGLILIFYVQINLNFH